MHVFATALHELDESQVGVMVEDDIQLPALHAGDQHQATDLHGRGYVAAWKLSC